MEIRLRDGVIRKFDGTQVMGIVNVTPDSFFSGSRCQDEEALRNRVRQIIREEATIIDVGAYSSRQDGVDIYEDEEMARLAFALPIIREELSQNSADNLSSSSRKQILLSIDTFRAKIARSCVEDFGADIINDISGGMLDAEMFRTIAELRVPYILMHMRGTPQTMQQQTDYPDGVTNAVIQYFRERIQAMEMTAHDVSPYEHLDLPIILDPGFGFAKTIEQNYQLFSNLSSVKRAFPERPLLVGISRKSMIYKLLDGSPEDSLNGTSVLNALAVAQGADILRVHDVAEAVNVVKTLTNY